MTTTRRADPAQALRALISQVRAALPVAPAPHYVDPQIDPEVGWQRRLDRIRSALEQARSDLAGDGWVSGAWFAVATASGSRPATTAESFALVRPGSTVAGACLVGTLLRRAADPDRATSYDDVWGCVDELYEAVHESMGHTSFPPGRCYPRTVQHARLRGVTAWNDTPGRTHAEVLDLVDRAVSRTLVGACTQA